MRSLTLLGTLLCFVVSTAIAGDALAGKRRQRRDAAADRRFDAASPWDKLGERIVDGRADHDTIPVGRADGRFTSIQLIVEDSAIVLFDVKVVFGDGSEFSPATRLVFEKNTKTRVIDLPGAARAIRRVEFRYADLPGGGRAHVELWGLSAPSSGWTSLGDRVVDGRADQDELQVGPSTGRFQRIMLTVEDSSLVMFDVVVHFANGTSFSPGTRFVFGEGSRSRAIDLPGDRRTITRVTFRYGNLPGGGRARVSVWAQ